MPKTAPPKRSTPPNPPPVLLAFARGSAVLPFQDVKPLSAVVAIGVLAAALVTNRPSGGVRVETTAHMVDEHVSIAEIEALTEIYAAILEAYFGKE